MLVPCEALLAPTHSPYGVGMHDRTVAFAPGRPASEVLTHAAAKMLEAKLGEHVRIPPLPPAAAARLFVRTRRDALWVGGLYRKLCRCAAVPHYPQCALQGYRLQL